jgi:hypothetical protein
MCEPEAKGAILSRLAIFLVLVSCRCYHNHNSGKKIETELRVCPKIRYPRVQKYPTAYRLQVHHVHHVHPIRQALHLNLLIVTVRSSWRMSRMEIKALSTPNWHFIVSSMQQSKVIDHSHRLGSLG